MEIAKDKDSLIKQEIKMTGNANKMQNKTFQKYKQFM